MYFFCYNFFPESVLLKHSSKKLFQELIKLANNICKKKTTSNHRFLLNFFRRIDAREKNYEKKN